MNWQQMVIDINNAGYTLPEIARQVGAKSHGTITAIKSGATQSPSYDIGVALVSLHKRAMRKAARQAARE